MYFVVTLALKMLIYALVNSAFSGFASLKLHLFIHSLRLWGWLSYFLVSLCCVNSLLLWLGLVGAKFKNITSLTFEHSTDSIKRGKSYSTHLARFEFRKIYNRNIYAL